MKHYTERISITTYQTATLQSKAHRAITTRLSVLLKKYDLTVPQWTVLGAVFDAENMRPYQVADLLGVRPPVATAVINELEQKKLMVRKPHPKDNRATVVVLTRKGKGIVGKAEPQIAKAMSSFLEGITMSEFTDYLRVLAKLAQE